jgi:hypothetical protein
MFTSLTNILSGNITLGIYRDVLYEESHSSSLELSTQSSKSLQTGPIACQDMEPTDWFDNLARYFPADLPSYVTRHTNIFDQPQWKCRNKTLAAAIEDFFNNITISMLSLNVS